MKLGYRLVVALGWISSRFFGKAKINGADAVPMDGPLLVIANHQSLFDPILLQVACRRHIRFLATHELFEMPLISTFVRYWKAIKITQSTADRGALKQAAAALGEGQCVGIFPEGGDFQPDGSFNRILPGVSLLIRLQKCQVICCGVRNSRLVIPKGKKGIRFAKDPVEANWGQPKNSESFASSEAFTDWIESELKALTFPAP